MFSYRGKPIIQVNTKAWYAALKCTGIEDFRWHDLRHTWASWHVQNGTPMFALQELGTGMRVRPKIELARGTEILRMTCCDERGDSVVRLYRFLVYSRRTAADAHALLGHGTSELR